MLTDSPLRQTRAALILPHIVDTVFLLSGVAMMLALHQFPFTHPWLTAKLAGLLAYIAFGAIALRLGRTRKVRAVALVLALCVFAYIVGVAHTRNPLGPFMFLPGG